jgi:ribosomal protein S27AE
MKETKDVERAVLIALVSGTISSLCLAIFFLIVILFFQQIKLQFLTPLFWLFRTGATLFIVVSVILGGIVLYKISSKKKFCPKCHALLPKWRIPKDRYEIFIGGWTCPNCGTKLTWQLRERP